MPNTVFSVARRVSSDCFQESSLQLLSERRKNRPSRYPVPYPVLDSVSGTSTLPNNAIYCVRLIMVFYEKELREPNFHVVQSKTRLREKPIISQYISGYIILKPSSYQIITSQIIA